MRVRDAYCGNRESKSECQESPFFPGWFALFEYVLSVTFIGLGLLKLFSGPALTKIASLTLGMSDPNIVSISARTLPIFEIALGVWLAIGVRRRAAAGTALATLTAFTCALIALGQVAGWGAPCNCTGSPTGEPIYIALMRNIALWGMAFVLAIVHRPNDLAQPAHLRLRSP